jgi:hypothetical protein
MKKVYITLLFITVFSESYAQKNFGEQFRDWVMQDAARNSRDLARNDFKPRTVHAVNRINERLLGEIRAADSVLNAVYRQIESDELALAGLDTLTVALRRARSARTEYYRLLDAENHLYFASRLKLNLDSLGSSTYFYGAGLYHVGRETLMESFVRVGEGFADNFSLKYQNHYTVSVNVNMNDNYQANGGSGSISQDGNATYTSIGVTTGGAIGTAVAPGIGTVIGGGIGLIVGGAADIFTSREKQKKERKKQEKEYKRQMKFLHEGIDSLSNQLAPVDTLLSYYQGYVKEMLDLNKPVYIQLDSAFETSSLRFKELFAYNIRRQQLSQRVLTVDQIALIERNFMSLASLRNFYSNMGRVNFIRDCNLMVGKLKNDLEWLKAGVSSRFDWLQRKEAFEDDLRYAQLILGHFLVDENYLPHHTYLTTRKTELDSLMRNLPGPPERAVMLRRMGSLQSMPSGGSDLSTAISSPERMLMPEVLIADEQSALPVNVGICFGTSGYNLCYGMNNGSYGGRFNNNGQAPVTDILGSSNDGGLRGFSATAGREIGAMQVNIRLRIEKLQNDYQQVTGILPQAHVAYKQEGARISSSASQLGQVSSVKIRAFNDTFDRQYPALQQRMDNYMNQPLRSGLADLQRDLGLTRQVNSQIRFSEIPVSVFNIAGRNYGYEVPGGVSSSALAWQREVGKQISLIKDIEARVNAGSDPVFTNKRKFEDFKANLVQLDKLLNQINNGNQYSHEVREQIRGHYLTQISKMRYAAAGLLPRTDLVPADYQFVERDQRESLNNLVQEIKRCDPASGDCMGGYGKAIYQLYNDKSVAGLRNSAGEPFNAANLQQLASNSSEWTELGRASSAGAIDQAALLAMSGNTVIATRNDGMEVSAGLVLPELPLTGGEQKWAGLQLPSILYIDEEKPNNSFARGLITKVYPDPSEVTFYARIKPRDYSALQMTVQNSGVGTYNYSDPLVGDQASVPALRLKIQPNSSPFAISEETIPVAGSYVERIVSQYGSNSKQVFEQLYSLRDELYGSYPANPVGLSNQEVNDLNALKQIASRFEDRGRLLNTPEDFYYTQTSRCLYASCVASLSKAVPSERSEILNYYNQVLSALVKYRDDVLNITTAMTPFVNDARDIYELVTGKDMITGAILTYWERGLSGAGLFLGSGVYWRYLSELPHMRRNALDLAEQGIPGISMVKSGDLKYHFKSDGGIYYEPWNPLSSGSGKRDRLTKIMEDHYSNPGNKTKFNVDHAYEIPALIDHAWKRAKDLNLVPFAANDGNIRYLVELESDHPTVVNGGMKYIVLVFDGARKDQPFIITAFPKKHPIIID